MLGLCLPYEHKQTVCEVSHRINWFSKKNVNKMVQLDGTVRCCWCHEDRR